jgi:hypothetical protein
MQKVFVNSMKREPTPPSLLFSVPSLNLHLLETVLPDGHEGGNTVLAVVEEDDHAVGVHGLAGEELVVLEVGNDLLGVARSLGLEVLNGGVVGALGLETLLDGLHVAYDRLALGMLTGTGVHRTLEVCEVALLVEASLVQAERVDDVNLLLSRVLGTLLLLLGGSIGTSVCIVLAGVV